MLFFGKSVDFGSGLGQRFKAVLITRNRLMHFLPDTHDFAHEGVVIRGLINVSDYNALSGAVAVDAVSTAEAFVGHLLFMQGLSPDRVQHALHHWLGKVPGAASYLEPAKSAALNNAGIDRAGRDDTDQA